MCLNSASKEGFLPAVEMTKKASRLSFRGSKATEESRSGSLKAKGLVGDSPLIEENKECL
jgi:hypothetical protein